MGNRFLDQKISECRAKLRDVHKQIEALNLRAASIEGELRAYDFVKNQSGDLGSSEELPDAPSPAAARPSSKPLKLRKSRLSPMWQAIFKELISVYPGTLSRASIDDIARNFGPIAASFRTGLWHHINRGYLEELERGMFRANQETAYRAGLPWSGPVKERPDDEKEFDLVGESP